MSDETPVPQSGDVNVPVDLTRRKPPRGDAAIASLREVRRAAAPYVTPYLTTARIALRKLAGSRSARAGALLIAGLAMVALFADLLASELPVACRWHGTLYLLPDVTHPAALEGQSCASMRSAKSANDWLIEPLVAHGPTLAGPPEDALLAPLTRGHPLGTDALGRDLFARVVHGTRLALTLGLAGSLALVALGVTFGALSGFLGGIVDALVSRAVEALMVIPTLLLVLVVEALVSHPTTATLLWTIALTRWPELARLVRAEVLRVLGKDYVTAARALGASPGRILARHVLPNAIGPAIVAASFGVASVIVVQAAVDFLHAGSPDTVASWGEALSEARSHPGAWWLIVFPAGALLASLIALNLIGDAARDALDPWSPRPPRNAG